MLGEKRAFKRKRKQEKKKEKKEKEMRIIFHSLFSLRYPTDWAS
jgi:hypothetical protein